MDFQKKPFDLLSPNAVLTYISVFKFLLLVLFAGNYGLFRDELYYIECSKHLDWGFIDQPPLSLFFLAISRNIFGESILGIRIFAYITGSATVFIAGLTARELGGGKFAQVLTALAVLFCGVALGVSGYYSMNVFDIFFACLMFYYLIKLINTDNPPIWYVIGIIFGIGLQNKLTFLFLGFGLAIGLLLTNNRKYFFRKELWIGSVIALLIFLPNIIWQISNNFPTLEFMRNASMYKNQPMNILEFSKNASFELNPGFVIFIITAFYFVFFNDRGKTYKLIGWMFVSVFLVFVFNNGKPYYMGVLYPVMLACGIVGAEIIIDKYLRNWIKTILIILVIPSAILVTPFAIPVLNVGDFIKFSETLGLKPALGERSELGVLPQFFADRFGWKEMVEKVAVAYNKLTDVEKKKAVIVGQNYGEASAVNYYGKYYGLLRAISGHNSYWMWGYPSDNNGDVMIVIGSNMEDNREFFEQVELAASHRNEYGMPYENVDIFICRKAKMPMSELWKRIRFFI